jgi:hypothetical protein
MGPRTSLDAVVRRKMLLLPGLDLRPLGRPARGQSLYQLLLILVVTVKKIIIMGYGLHSWGSIPGRGKAFFSSPRCPDRLWGPPSLLPKWVVETLSLGGKAALA